MRVIPVLVLALMLTQPVAAKIYKWVDENGQTRYSQTPPNNVPGDAEPMGSGGDTAFREPLAQRIKALIWSTRIDGASYEMSIHDNGYAVIRVLPSGSARSVAGGEWTLRGKLLEIEHTSGSRDIFEGARQLVVIEATDSRLVLQGPGERRRTWYRMADRRLTRASEQALEGKWKDRKSSWRLTLGAGTFYHPDARGNWRYEDPYIVLRYTRHTPAEDEGPNRTGKEYRFFVHERSEHRLVLEDPATGHRYDLIR